MKVAILDLGTNIFNLLLSEISGKTCKILKVVKIPSFIGAGGFSTGKLSEEAMSKSIDALEKIREIIDQEGDVGFIKVFATSAFRDTVNGSEFANNIRDNFGFEVEIISGDREAELIYKGIRESFFILDENVLMCDIGGGSNELIIADKEKILWKRSFNLGILRLKEQFKPSDPIKEEEVKMVNLYLEQELKPLFEACKRYLPKLMIGSSGSFDTLRELLYRENNTNPVRELDMTELGVLHQKLLVSNREERLRMPGMSPVRVDYMVLGSIFIQLVIEKCRISKLYQSSYSLKEGFMAEMAAQL
jgi:exopolyphosphatase/guanosine-5'-triphosphate,3'-diphosphate pyrophosphatase